MAVSTIDTLYTHPFCVHATAPFDQDDKSTVGAKTFTVKTFDPAHGAEWTVVDLATFETEKVMTTLTAHISHRGDSRSGKDTVSQAGTCQVDSPPDCVHCGCEKSQLSDSTWGNLTPLVSQC